MIRLKSIYVFFVVSFLLVGCSVSADLPTEIVQTQSGPVEPPGSRPSLSIPSTQVLTPSISKQASTPGTSPTMNPSDADKLISSLLKENSNCLQPCFWNIVPGSTNIADSVGLFTLLANSYGREVYTHTENASTLYGVHFTQKTKMDLTISLLGRDDELINIKARVSGLSEKNIDNTDWSAFRPEKILTTYGLPDRVALYVVEGPVAYSYGFVFYYPELIIDYLAGDIALSKDTQICPLAEHQIQQFDFLLGKELAYDPIGEKNIEDVSQLSALDFYHLLTGDPEKACFSVNFDLYQQ